MVDSKEFDYEDEELPVEEIEFLEKLKSEYVRKGFDEDTAMYEALCEAERKYPEYFK